MHAASKAKVCRIDETGKEYRRNSGSLVRAPRSLAPRLLTMSLAISSCFEFIIFAVAFRHDNSARYESSYIHDSAVDTKGSLQSFRLSAVQLCGAFFFAYVGVESGWFSSCLVDLPGSDNV